MVTDDSVHDLVRAAQVGDRGAFQRIVERFQPRLENQIRSRMGASARRAVEVEDVLQETFAAAFESIRKLKWQGEESFYRWLGSIAEHLIWAAAQKKTKSPLKLESDVPAGEASPSRHVRRNERFDRLESALKNLSEDHRQVIILARIERLGIDDVARRMNRSPNAVKKLLARALLALKQSFGDTESLHLPDRFLETEEGEHGE